MGKFKRIALLFVVFAVCLTGLFACSKKRAAEDVGYAIAVYAFDVEEAYDGTAKNIRVNLIEGAEAKYYLEDGTEFFGATEPAEYIVTVQVTFPSPYYAFYERDTAKLTITKAFIDMSSVAFSHASYVYDGTPKTIECKGTLPDGVSVAYENNTATEAGEYNAVARFSVAQTQYYHEIQEMTARLEIKKRPYDPKDFGFYNTAVVYDKKPHTIELSFLPEGLSVSYVMSEGTQAINAGTYLITAVFSYLPNSVFDRNYSKGTLFTSPPTAVLTIMRAEFSAPVWKKPNLTYLAEPFLIGTGASFPLGLNAVPTAPYPESFGAVTVEYLQKSGSVFSPIASVTNAGTYTIYAKFTMPEGALDNYLPLEQAALSFTVLPAAYLKASEHKFIQPDPFVYDGAEHTFEAIGYDASEVKVTYVGENVLKNAGTYKITAKFELLYDKENYYPLASLSIEVVILPMPIDISSVRFDGLNTVYDGTEKSVSVTGLPSNIAVAYYALNKATNAGTYVAQAHLYYDPKAVPTILYGNYALLFNGKEQTDFYATLFIDKAVYDANSLPTYTVPSSGTAYYSPNKRLSDYAISNANGNVKWADANRVPDVSTTLYRALYNADPVNYYDCDIFIELILLKAVIVSSGLSIPNQFLPRSVNNVYKPEVVGSDVPQAVFSVELLSFPTLSSYGKYIGAGARITLNDSVNYRFDIGTSVETGAFYICVYDGNLFDYTLTRLIRVKGNSTDIEVPDGTEEITAAAFGSAIRTLFIPDSVSVLREGTFVSASGLTSLSVRILPSVALPASLESLTVRNEDIIAARAFLNKTGLKRVVYLAPVAYVGEYAFDGCTSLTEFYFPYGGDFDYGASIFRDCYLLNGVSVPHLSNQTIAYLIGTNAGDTYKNYLWKTLEITSLSMTSLPDNAFAGLSKIGQITIPSTVTAIGERAFALNTARLILPSLVSIGKKAFEDYKGTGLTIPSSVVTIGEYAFNNATNLTEIALPKDLIAIGQYAFQNVAGEVKFNSAAVITAIGERAFCGYKNAKITLPSTVASIGSYAFSLSGLTEIVLGDNVVSLGSYVFYSCSSLIEASFNIDPSANMFASCAKLARVVIGAKAKRINDDAFKNCTSLLTFTIPVGIEDIGGGAFFGCDLLSVVTFTRSSPPTFTSTSFPKTLPVIVRCPFASYNAYANAFHLLGYGNISFDTV